MQIAARALVVVLALLMAPWLSAAFASIPAKVVTNTGPGKWENPAGLCTAIQDYWKWHSAQPGSTSCGTVDILNGCPSWPQLNTSRTIKPWYKNSQGACVLYSTYSQGWIASCPTNSSYAGNGVCVCSSGASPGLGYCWKDYEATKNYGCDGCVNNPANPGAATSSTRKPCTAARGRSRWSSALPTTAG